LNTPESQGSVVLPVSALLVEECLVLTVLVHVTEHPGVMVTVEGVNTLLDMVTCAPHGTEVAFCETVSR